VSEIESTFGVDASAAAAAPVAVAAAPGAAGPAPAADEEKTTFDVILEEIPGDKKVLNENLCMHACQSVESKATLVIKYGSCMLCCSIRSLCAASLLFSESVCGGCGTAAAQRLYCSSGEWHLNVLTQQLCLF